MVPAQVDLADESAMAETPESDDVVMCQSWPEEDCFLSYELVIEQLKTGIHPDQVINNDCETMLIKALDAASVQALLSAGADVNAKNDEGRTPLQHAKDDRIIQLLKDAGANNE